MKNTWKIAALLGVVALVGCTGTGAKIANAPTYDGSLKKTGDILYNPTTKQALDIYTDSKAGADKRPVVMFIYGGRWEGGDKADYRFLADALVKKGYLVVIPDYRKYPEVKFPGFVEDTAKAIAWTKANIAAYGGDESQLFLMGHSAGAHIASLLVTDMHYLQAVGMKPTDLRAFAGLAGPYSFTPDEKDLKDMFGPPENYPNMQATTFVSGKEPPVLLLWGDADDAVGRFNLEKMQAALKAKGASVQSKIYPGISHVEIVGAFSRIWRGKAPVVDDVDAFFKAHMH